MGRDDGSYVSVDNKCLTPTNATSDQINSVFFFSPLEWPIKTYQSVTSQNITDKIFLRLFWDKRLTVRQFLRNVLPHDIRQRNESFAEVNTLQCRTRIKSRDDQHRMVASLPQTREARAPACQSTAALELIVVSAS